MRECRVLDISFFAMGLGIGFATSAPVGPVNILAIQRAFRYGFFSGSLAGVGAVLADTIYAAFAALGITAVADFIEDYTNIIQIIGGLVVIVFGLRVIRSHPHLETGGDGEAPKIWSGLFASFFVTVTNPGVVLGFLAIFGSLGAWAPDKGDYVAAGAMVAGVACGAMLWWIFVSAVVSKARERMNDVWLEWINRVAGGLLICFGVGIFIHLLWRAISGP